jgi:hypothetical protein
MNPAQPDHRKRRSTRADIGANRQFAEELAAIWQQATPAQRREIAAFITAQIWETEELHDLLAELSPAQWRVDNPPDDQE